MIVQAVGICVGTLDPAKIPLAQRMQEAMTKAVEQALAEGVAITDSDEIRRRIDAAQAKVAHG